MALKYVTVFSYLLQLCVINIQNIRNKVGEFNDMLFERNLDFMLLTEFWMEPTDADYHFQVGKIDSEHYSVINYPRSGKRGGGIAIIHKNKYSVKAFE